MSQQTATFTVSVNSQTNPLMLIPSGGALPSEIVGIPVNDLVTKVSGGKPPYSFAVSNGAVPDGLSLNATVNADGSEDITIEGTPTVVGDFSFDLTVTDADGQSATAGVTRTIS